MRTGWTLVGDTMKQYVIDELRYIDYEKLKAYLDEHFAVAQFDELYWVPLGDALLDTVQKEHDTCRPHYFALELFPDRLVCELLVRTQQHVRCQCIQYATREQRDWLIDLMDGILGKLGISV